MKKLILCFLILSSVFVFGQKKNAESITLRNSSFLILDSISSILKTNTSKYIIESHSSIRDKSEFNLEKTAQKTYIQLPKGFVYLENIEPSIKVELRYFSKNNFIGKPINGYKSDCLIITIETANSLKKIQHQLLKKGLSLKIFDAYRPQQAVNHFVRWAKVLNDTLMKKQYYPKVPKSELFKQGYIASKSGHSRGSTVDLTIIDTKTGKELDMGSPYDFFGEESHPFYKNISPHQKRNRLYLRKIMLDNGFKPYDNEWWHFTLKEEPFPKKYFNFPVE